MKNGVTYIAFKGKRDDYLKELNVSARSVKEIHPDLDLFLFTDHHSKSLIDETLFADIFIIDIRSTRVKQDILYDSPFDNTLYLDCDTKVVGPITEIFGLMKRFDIAACMDPIRFDPKKADVFKKYANIPEPFSELAGGVILYRKSNEVKKFFELWKENYAIWCNLSGRTNDQPSFRVTLWECSGLKIYVLPPEYNLRTQGKRDKFNLYPKIFHWHNMFDPNLKRKYQCF